ncbi:hypothetical protein [Agromyces aureus]|uniref:Bacterial Ig-like domain-containing protein n=1 Tax=Agromyces aureus TaxID=453304 RepID=A0A191WIQ2_9MICO|nr:hypothetical protein [Agromyces aureus]ANJ28136.1 hypothetical protein ATC03_16885 [Agromyces aureus]
MKRTLPALVVAVLGAGLALAGTVAPAAAATPTPATSIVGSCDALSVDLAGYAVEPGADAVYETVEVSPAVAEVSHTDYQYSWSFLFWGETRWAHKDSGAHVIYDSKLWERTGLTQTHVEVAAQDAVTEQQLVSAAIPADATPNTVTVTIDGATVVDGLAFGAEYAPADFALAKGTPGTETYGTHTYSVSVTAYQGYGAEPVASVVDSGSTECATGDFAAAATIDTDTTCGAAIVTLTNAELLASKINGTYSAIVSVDGKMKDIVAVFENAPLTLDAYTFAEDSGEHTVEVRTGPAHGDALLAKTTVDSDCLVDEEEPAPPVDPSISITGSLTPGGKITVTGEDFAADTEYEIELHSTPQSIASVTTDSEGSFSGTGTIASDTPAGEHEIVVLQDGEEVASKSVTITAAPSGTTTDAGTTAGTGTTAATGAKAGLASTGFDATPLAALAAALLALAGIAFGARRAIRVKG